MAGPHTDILFRMQDYSLTLFAASFFDPEKLIVSGGLALIAFIIFAECGLLFGVVFPGDTLLVAIGVFASQGHFTIQTALAVIISSAIAGGIAGYYIGQRAGPRIFVKDDGLFFRREYIEKSELFYDKHGGKTIALARFVPIVRTFAPVVAGVANMNIGKFMFYNILGSVIWGTSITLTAYYLGSRFPFLVNNLELIFLFVVPFILGPPLYHIYDNYRKKSKSEAVSLKKDK